MIASPAFPTRRNLILASIAASAVAMLKPRRTWASSYSDAIAKRRRAPKVDFHHHMIPPLWADALRSTAAAKNLRNWSPEASLAFMDASSIQAAMLSLTTPGPAVWDDGKQRDMLRRVNEYGANLVAKNPPRFGLFAALPLPDIDGSLKEIEYAFDQLRADGVILMSNIGDQYLGDKIFAPIWAELERREAVVFIHPNNLSLPEIPGIPPALVDFPLSTTRAAVDMVVHGMITPESKMKVILSHGGGFLPYISQRIVYAGSTLPGAPPPDVLQKTYRRFYFDTTISSSTPTLAALTKFADPSHILFGSDFPYGAGSAQEFTRTLESSDALSGAQYNAIVHGNAARLFPGRFGV